jgi:hypothetical protein
MGYTYRTSIIPTRIVMVGAGGTGGRLIPLLAQFIKTLDFVLNPEIYIIDADVA